MKTGFIIMQIGNAELDELCEKIIVPAMEACGLEPKRVDKHNEGALLKSEIIRFIGEAEIIVADLTNERPNCYLEIGYAMGIDKFRNLVLTAREDHDLESPNHKAGGPKVHFDLVGYDILWWRPGDGEAFRSELEKRIRRRKAILAPSEGHARAWDDDWLAEQRSQAETGLKNQEFNGGIEIRFSLEPPKIKVTQTELREAARRSTIHTFGWPIGVYLNRDEYRPRPRSDGIFAEIAEKSHRTYDYWAINKNGDTYLLSSYFEDEDHPRSFFFNIRIARVTEALLYCAHLYSNLGVDRDSTVSFAIKHSGLKGRVLSSSNRDRQIHETRTCSESEMETQLSFTIGGVEGELVELVKRVMVPTFMLFDFLEFEDSIYEGIVEHFLKGRVT